MPDYGTIDSLFDEIARALAARVLHPSDEEAFAAARAAVADQPFELEGPMRKRYFSSAGDQRFALTEIQFPLRPS